MDKPNALPINARSGFHLLVSAACINSPLVRLRRAHITGHWNGLQLGFILLLQ